MNVIYPRLLSSLTRISDRAFLYCRPVPSWEATLSRDRASLQISHMLVFYCGFFPLSLLPDLPPLVARLLPRLWPQLTLGELYRFLHLHVFSTPQLLNSTRSLGANIMAIIDARPGIEVTVTSGNRTLREYREKETIDAPNAATNYIEVNSFESFEVSIETFNDFAQGYDFQVMTWLDGVFIESHVRILNASRKNRLNRAPGVKTEVNRCLCTCDLQFTPFLIGTQMFTGASISLG